MDRRNDYKTALLIEAIIHDNGTAAPSAAPSVATSTATSTATSAATSAAPTPARQLAALGVPIEVTMRVLTRPAERRSVLPEPMAHWTE